MRTTDVVVNSIKQGIRQGRYSPGQRLVESDLVTELGATRGHVREALRLLAGEGIVEIVPQKGARVRKLDENDMAQMMPVMAGLLGVAIELAMPRLRDPQFRDELEKLMGEMRQQAASGNALGFHHVSGSYHRVLIAAAKNPFLEYLNEKTHSDLFRNQFIGTIEIDDWSSYLAHFQAMHDALMSGDADAAKALISQHQRDLLDGGYGGDFRRASNLTL